MHSRLAFAPHYLISEAGEIPFHALSHVAKCQIVSAPAIHLHSPSPFRKPMRENTRSTVPDRMYTTLLTMSDCHYCWALQPSRSAPALRSHHFSIGTTQRCTTVYAPCTAFQQQGLRSIGNGPYSMAIQHTHSHRLLSFGHTLGRTTQYVISLVHAIILALCTSRSFALCCD
jgi:hypothetical protein